MPITRVALAQRLTRPSDIPPLTRNGYTRTARAQADILTLSALNGPALVAAFRTADEGYADYHCAEALVYFIRQALGRGDARTVELLFEALISRCQGYFRSAVRGLDDDARADVQGDVLADMTRLLLADDDGGDFLQSRFWLYLRRRTVTARADWLRARRRSPLADDLAGTDEVAAVAESRLPANDLSPEGHAILRDALARLPGELRELVVLRHLEGWRVGDEPQDRRDAADPTLAERYGITPRAVRKRLARAEALLNTPRKDDR